MELNPQVAHYVVHFYGHLITALEWKSHRHLFGAMKATRGRTDAAAQREAQTQNLKLSDRMFLQPEQSRAYKPDEPMNLDFEKYSKPDDMGALSGQLNQWRVLATVNAKLLNQAAVASPGINTLRSMFPKHEGGHDISLFISGAANSSATLRGWTKSRFGDERVGIPSHQELVRRKQLA